MYIRRCVGYPQMAERKQSRKDANLQKWLQKFDDSWLYAQQNYHERWERNWKLYHNQRWKRSHPGVVKTFVPMVNSLVNTIVAALSFATALKAAACNVNANLSAIANADPETAKEILSRTSSLVSEVEKIANMDQFIL